MSEKMTIAEFTEVVDRIKGYFREFVLDEKPFLLWYEQLKVADRGHIERGVDEYARKNKFPPRLADIIEYATNEYKADGRIGSEVTEQFLCLRNIYPIRIPGKDKDKRFAYLDKCREIFNRRTVGTYGFTKDAVKAAGWIYKLGVIQVQMVDKGEREHVPFDKWLEAVEIE